MTTMQTRAVMEELRLLRHATNHELHDALASRMPELSLPSLHRITARLLARGVIGQVPSASSALVLDARPDQHDHFICFTCQGIIDLELSDQVFDDIQAQLGTNLVQGGLVVRGRCARCVSVTDSSIANINQEK